MYRVKEMFYSLQGEGARAGRAAVFCRFSKCNLWNGREESRAQAVCNFCDTDIVGIDGQNGGKFESPESLANTIAAMWPTLPDEISSIEKSKPYVIFTGGEPLLQLDEALIEQMHLHDFEVAIESNGTLPLPKGVDWVCLSPKSDTKLVLTECDELKLVYPQEKALPERFENFKSSNFFLSPMANPLIRFGEDTQKKTNTQLALEYCLKRPQWRLTLQLHKLLGID